MAKDKREAGEWSVIDLNARTQDGDGNTKPRMHESRIGRIWPLRFDRPCYMPEADARMFLKDTAFQVYDADDELVPSLSAQQLSRKLPDKLDPEYCVASLHELTTEALLTRAAQREGGHRFSSATGRDTLINFLVDGQAAMDRATIDRDRLTDGEVDDLDEAAVRKALEGA